MKKIVLLSVFIIGIIFIFNSNVYAAKVEYTKDMILNQNQTINGDLFIKNGVINLNGKTLTVNGNVMHTGGFLKVSRGKLIVKGNYQLCDYSKDPKSKVKMIDSNGQIFMQNEEDKIIVGKDFICKSKYVSLGINAGDYINYTAGTLEIKGNLIQKNNEKGYCTFHPAGKFIILLSGTSEQTISCETPVSLNDLEITNTKGKVKFFPSIVGWT